MGSGYTRKCPAFAGSLYSFARNAQKRDIRRVMPAGPSDIPVRLGFHRCESLSFAPSCRKSPDSCWIVSCRRVVVLNSKQLLHLRAGKLVSAGPSGSGKKPSPSSERALLAPCSAGVYWSLPSDDCLSGIWFQSNINTSRAYDRCHQLSRLRLGSRCYCSFFLNDALHF